MTNQQLKAHCEDVIANPQDHSEMVLSMAKALLPCLNAEPGIFEWRFKSEPVSRWLALPIERLQEAKDTFGDMVEYRFWCSAPPAPELKPIDFEEDEAAFEKGVSALIDCLEDCGDAEQGLRLALRAMTGVKS